MDLIVEPLTGDRLAEAYPLVRAATRVSLARWEEFGRELLECGGGILAVTAADKCLHGVATYRQNRNLRHKQSLDVDVIVAFDLRADDRVREALCQALEKVAADLGCSTMTYTMSAKNAAVVSTAKSGLERLGLKLDTASFVREMP